MPIAWYGISPAWRVSLEAAARRELGNQLQVIQRPGKLEYRAALDVHGPGDLVVVRVVFYAYPLYDTFQVSPWNYPRVWAEPGAASKHRMPDDALCLYHPQDPVGRRWTDDKGLLDLLDVTVDHLGYEAHWRATGGTSGGIWLGDEADHGLSSAAA